MVNQDVEDDLDSYLVVLKAAGLDKALALFPEDVLVAVQTATQVCESFSRLSGYGQHE